MQNDKEKIENGAVAGRRWQFWFLVSFSLLLVVTFVFYLPTRFERDFLREEMGHTEEQGMAHGGHGETRYHEEGEVTEGLAVNFNIAPAAPVVQTPAALQFFVNEKPGNIPVPASALQIEHEKLMHVIGVRSDMNEFFHIHPQPEEQLFVADYVFPQPGLYKVWSEIKKDDIVHAFGHPVFSVGGEGPKEEKQVSFGRNVIVGNYQVALELAEPVETGHEQGLSFTIHTLTSGEVELNNYLGAPMHLSVIKDDLEKFIHAHPEEGGDHSHSLAPESFGFIPIAKANGGPTHSAQEEHHANLNFHVTFPDSGLYKLFAQFRPEGSELGQDEALLATFWVQVQEVNGPAETDDHEHAPGAPEDHHHEPGEDHESTQLQPLVSPEWWLYLVVSVVAIAALSFGVNKFITVKK